MKSEFKLNNYTPKGWILKSAEDVYNEVQERGMASGGGHSTAFEQAIYAALDAAVEVGLLKENR